MFLTADELRELTERVRAVDQVAWLRHNGIPFLTSARGSPRVLRACIEARLGLRAHSRGLSGPNFAAIERFGKRRDGATSDKAP